MTQQFKVALVTGAGSGIGKATALAFLQDGYRVVLAGRRAQALQDVATFSGAPERTLVVPSDVTDETSVVALFDTAVRVFGRVDVVFNNAGTGEPGVLLEDLTLSQWQKVVDVNLTGMFLCLRQTFRVMKAQTPQGGRIINNGSISAHAPRPGSVAYTTTKHAITGLTKTLSLDGRPFDIACGQIDIGNAMTDLAAKMAKGVPQADGQIRVEAMMDADEVASAVLHMAILPLSTNVQFMTIMATKMPFVGRG
ncbi:glucose 1-dehydrogenase 4 [mine drainage metagenome]|uniref:Glucose 1-dehydrogenase 4 n=1 Tax=mine drainage metagenome TaxID=410659 RepID=A0A1J5PZE7_9ZZZZ